MKIGRNTEVRSAICTHDAERIVVRGMDLADDLIGRLTFADYFFFLVTGRQPDRAASAIVNATLVAIAEHGLVPSVQAARMTLAAAPDALQGAVAAGLLGSGSVILGASETAGRLFTEIDRHSVETSSSLEASALYVVGQWRARGSAIPGFGHPEHKQRDPRVGALFAVAARVSANPRFIEIAQVVESIIEQAIGKPLRLNVSGAIPAVLLGVGFPVVALKGVPMLARTASLIAHLTEEAADPIGFALSYHATAEQHYTGLAAAPPAGKN